MRILINKRSGFTLIEIVVVLIIVGILAAIALPNLYQNVTRSRSHEALASITSYRNAMEGCIYAHPAATNTCTDAFLANARPATTNFTYAFTAPANATDTGYAITATGRVALAGTDTIAVTRAAAVFPATGAVTCVGNGALVGVC